mmetsp:Transcript_885/g.1361  ORF Transcript_885/g.1361 Transcript_885/m.1361 type:complete len:201 (+) Transcript_885:250-852(+)
MEDFHHLRVRSFSFLVSSVSSDSDLLLGGSHGGARRGGVGGVGRAALQSLLEGDAVGHAAHRVLALKHLQLSGSVLVEELVEGQVAAADLDLNLVTDAHDADALAAELVHAVALTHEHDLQLLSVRVVVNILSELLVDRVVLDGNVDRNARLQIDDVLAQRLDLVVRRGQLRLVLLHLLEHFELGGLRLVELFLELGDVS